MLSLKEYTAARDTLTEKDFTKAGLPKMSALNAALRGMNQDEIDAEQRDLLEEDAQEVIAAPAALTIVVEDAATSPLTLWINGSKQRFRFGEPYEVTPETVEALRNSHVKFRIKE